MKLSFDERAFYADGKKIRQIEEIVNFAARPEDSLYWDETPFPQKPFLAKIDLGLFEEDFIFDDPHHQTRTLAIKHFMETIYPKCSDLLHGVILYQGKIPSKDPAYLDALSYHLSHYAYLLDDHLPIFLLFDIEELGMSESVHLLEKKRFSHAVLGLKGSSLPFSAFSYGKGRGKYGCIGKEAPPNEERDLTGLLVPAGNFDETLKKLEGVPYRFLYEEDAHTSWDELDQIIVFEKMITPKARRILLGFEAAGGKAVVVGGNLGFFEEISLEKFLEIRGRGI